MLTYTPLEDVEHVVGNPIGEIGGKLWSRSDPSDVGHYAAANGVDYPPAKVRGGGGTHRPRDIRLPPHGAGRSLSGLLSHAAGYIPPLKHVIPRSVFSPVNEFPELRRRQLATTVVAMAAHPHAHWLATAIRSPSSGETSIEVYDVADSTFHKQVLRHAFMREVSCLVWKPKSRAVLAVGVLGGCLVWDLTFTLAHCVAFGPDRDRALGSAGPKRVSEEVPVLQKCLPEELKEVELGACVFFPSSSGAAVTTATFTNESGKYLAVGGLQSLYIDVFDVSRPPAGGPIATLDCFEGCPRQLVFSADDRYLLHGIDDWKWLACWSTRNWRRHMFSVGCPVTHICPMQTTRLETPDDMFVEAELLQRAQGSQLVLSLWRAEGLVIARIISGSSSTSNGIRSWRQLLDRFSSPSLRVLAKINTTGLVGGISVGGAIFNVAAHLASGGARIAVELESGHLLFLHLSNSEFRIDRGPTGEAVSSSAAGGAVTPSFCIRGIGVADLQSVLDATKRDAGHGVSSMSYLAGCRTGSLLALLLSTGELRFIPSYYSS